MGLFSNLIEQEGLIIPLLIINAILGILVIINIIYTIMMKKKYIDFMARLGNGKNLDEMLRKYLDDVREIKKDNSEIKAYYTKLDNDIDTCIQKIGLVRYNAFKDVGSDLSFAIAMLDRNDNGVILNGLYGSESSNIYAKPIKNGMSKYQLSEEEKTALEIAEQSKNFIAKHKK
ncbi:MAG: DUF4446 family protein [Clostridia bacterium]|nr:DUF4446 family protein [Clostridia bacterium]